MTSARKVAAVLESVPTIEGAGVHLRRAFGYNHVPMLDPFLMLDDFRSDKPEEFIRGFPWHPHRGIKTVTYMLEGTVDHGDSMGNSGTIGAGDMQWMTAGSGIIHQEMPKPIGGRMGGFQLWVNLPAKHKMVKPAYQEIKTGDVPTVELDGTKVRVMCGRFGGETGPVKGIAAEPEYLDVAIGPGGSFEHPIKDGHSAFAYVFYGGGKLGAGKPLMEHSLALYDKKGAVRAEAGKRGLRFLLVSGNPIGEPVAWGGPIVMNTEEELRTAFIEYREGTFLKK